MTLPIRQGATHKVVLGPAVAVGDGFTPVTTLALTTADEAEAILHDNGTVVSISGYTWAAITTADGYYHLTLQSGISNTVGHLTIVVNDDSLVLPVSKDFVVIDTVAYDALYADAATLNAPGISDIHSRLVVMETAIDSDQVLDITATSNIHSRLVIVETAIDSDQVIAIQTISDIKSALVVVDGVADTIASDLILAQTDLDTLTSDTAVIEAFGAPPTAAVNADAVWDELLTGASHNDASSAGRRLRQLATSFVIAEGTAQAGAATTITLAAGESAIDDIFRGDRVQIVAGTGAGEHEIIISYVGSTKVATVADTWITTPDATSEYILVPASVDVESIQHVVQTAGDLAALITTVDGVADTIASDLLVIEAAIDSDQLVDATATSNIHSRLVVMETALDSDQVIAVQTISDIKSALVVVDTVADTIASDLILAQTDLDTITSDTAAIESSSGVIVSGISDSGTTLTMVDSARTEGDTDYWVGNRIQFTSGTIIGQVREITGFNFTTNTITFSPATTQAVATQTYDIISGVAVSGLSAAQASDLALTEVANSNIHSRLVVIETAADSDQVVDATATSNIHSRLVVIETAIDSDQVIAIQTISDVKSALVVVDGIADTIASDLLVIEAAIDSDQLVDATATSNIHSRLVVVETAIDSDQVLDATATSNIHSRLVVMETAIDSDQVLAITATSDIKSALVVVDGIADTIASDLILAQTDLDTITSDTAIIEADTVQLTLGLIFGTTEGATDTTTATSSDLTGYADDQLIGRIITFTSGAAEGESSDITDFALTNGVITYTAMTTAAGTGSTFKIT